MDIQSIKRKRYVYLFASAISFLVLGLVYGWSLFATPLAEIYGWEMSAVKMTFTFCMMAFCVGGLIGVKVLKGLGLRGAILLAAALLVCGFGGTALLAPQGIWALWICYGVLIGCGTGLGYNVTIASITPWFPDKSGFASGVMFAGFGLGSITLGTLTRGIIGAAGITATAGTVMVILSLLLKRAPENIAEILGVTAKKTKTAPDADADNRKIFKDPAFYTYYLWAIIILGAGLTMIGTSMQGAVELGVAETFAATLTGVIPIVNGFSGFSMGVVYDKLGLRKCMILVAGIGFVGLAMLAASFQTGASAVYIVGCLVLVVAYGSVAPLAAGFARERYGNARYPHHLAIVNTDIAGGSAFQQAVSSACAGASPAVYLALTVFGGVAFLTSVIHARITKPKKA